MKNLVIKTNRQRIRSKRKDFSTTLEMTRTNGGNQNDALVKNKIKNPVIKTN